MKIFDVNCMLGRPATETLRHFDTASELLREMDDIGIERAVVFHAEAQSIGIAGNRRLMREVKNQPRLVPAWLVAPRALASPGDIRDYLKEMLGQGVRMARMQPGPLNKFSPYHWVYREFFEGLIQHGMVLHLDYRLAANPGNAPLPEFEWGALYDLARAMPDLNIVLFAPKLSVSMTQTMGLLRSCPNVMLDMSALQQWRATERVLENAGAEQLVFGGFMPYFDAAQFVVQLACAAISETDKQKIAGGNLAAVVDGKRGEA